MIGVEVKHTAVKGRGLYATKYFNVGDVIFEEKPLVSCQFSWNSTYGYLACDNCMRPLETAEANVQRLTNDHNISLPHLECCVNQEWLQKHTNCPNCGIKYCCQECLNEANNKYHAALCLGGLVSNPIHPINRLNDAWKKMHYPPETCSIMLMVRMLGMIKQSPNREELLSKFNEFQDTAVNEDLMIFHKLLGENFAQQLDELFRLLCGAFDCASEDCFKWLTPAGFKSLFALIGTNGQGIGTSSFANWVKNVSDLTQSDKEKSEIDNLIDELYAKLDEVSGTFLNNEGSALYLNQSKINHSCVPNAESSFPHSNYVLALTAVEKINVGDEICISYLDECGLERSRHSRQKELSENYLFVCQCVKCELQITDPDETSEDEDDDNEMDDSSD